MAVCQSLLVETPKKGEWRDKMPQAREIWLEIGAGKGRFTAETAAANPDVLYIAIERVPDAMIVAMERVLEMGLSNVYFIDGDAALLEEYFAPDEVSRIYVNFCDPWPTNRHARRRLTHANFLALYRRVLPVGGELHFKTDNSDLYEFSLFQFPKAGYDLTEVTRDLHAKEITGIMTDYEEKFHNMRTTIKRCVGIKQSLAVEPEFIPFHFSAEDHQKSLDFNALALKMHEDNRGKIEVISKVSVKSANDLSTAYTPGVAEPCRKIAENKQEVYRYTAKGNMVAVVSDGTAVLGLGNIGPEASLPVMEGKSLLFKEFGDVDGFPICLDVHDTEEIIRTVKAIAPSFGGINLEDIASPQCFEIEKRLEAELDIPVFHDDQHGTAIVVTAGLLNALKVVGKSLDQITVVLNGPGAAGTAIIQMLQFAGVKTIIACDEFGILHPDRAEGMIPHKAHLATVTNPKKLTGGLAEAVVGADVFIGVSAPNVLTPEMVKTMASDPVVFAMANPVPEIAYAEAMEAGVRVMGTGRSDNPNQINNVLAFPGVFRGALRCGARDINYEMKFAAAKAIAEMVEDEKRSPTYIIPSPFDVRVAEAVAVAVEQAAHKTGVAGKRR